MEDEGSEAMPTSSLEVGLDYQVVNIAPTFLPTAGQAGLSEHVLYYDCYSVSLIGKRGRSGRAGVQRKTLSYYNKQTFLVGEGELLGAWTHCQSLPPLLYISVFLLVYPISHIRTTR
jgi:hypothetical protein